MRCKACNAILSNKEQTYNEEINALEDLCKKCIHLGRGGNIQDFYEDDDTSSDFLTHAANLILGESKM